MAEAAVPPQGFGVGPLVIACCLLTSVQSQSFVLAEEPQQQSRWAANGLPVQVSTKTHWPKLRRVSEFLWAYSRRLRSGAEGAGMKKQESEERVSGGAGESTRRDHWAGSQTRGRRAGAERSSAARQSAPPRRCSANTDHACLEAAFQPRTIATHCTLIRLEPGPAPLVLRRAFQDRRASVCASLR